MACTFPQDATGESESVDRLIALPEFNHALMIEAMTSTDDRIFAVWCKAD